MTRHDLNRPDRRPLHGTSDPPSTRPRGVRGSAAVVLAVTTTVAAALTGAACSAEPDDVSVGSSAASALPNQQDSTTPRQRTTQKLPGHGAPAVTSPVNVTRWERSPCELLARDELAKLGFEPFRIAPFGDGGPGCEYSQLSFVKVRTTVFTDVPDGLTRLYGERDKFALFEPADPLRTHPAVIADVKDQRSQGRCALFVGLSDEQAFRVIVEAVPGLREGKNPCAFASDLAVLALDTMHKDQS